MIAGDPLEQDAADSSDGEKDGSFDAEKMMGVVSRSDEQNGDTR